MLCLVSWLIKISAGDKKKAQTKFNTLRKVFLRAAITLYPHSVLYSAILFLFQFSKILELNCELAAIKYSKSENVDWSFHLPVHAFHKTGHNKHSSET